MSDGVGMVDIASRVSKPAWVHECIFAGCPMVPSCLFVCTVTVMIRRPGEMLRSGMAHEWDGAALCQPHRGQVFTAIEEANANVAS